MKSGRLMDSQIREAYRWLEDRADGPLPAEFDFQLADLQACFFKRSTSTAHAWIAALEDEGLLQIVDSRQGFMGCLRVRLFDPEQVAIARLAKSNPQAELPFAEEADVVPFATSGDTPAGVAPEDEETSIQQRCVEVPVQLSTEETSIQQRCVEVPVQLSTEETSIQQRCVEVPQTGCAVGGPPSALIAALRQRLGTDRVETWLGLSRWEFGETVKLFLPTAFHGEMVRKLCGLEHVRAALADAGISGDVDVLVDEELRSSVAGSKFLQCSIVQELRSSNAASKLPPASQPALAYRNPSGVSISKQASPASDFWDEQRLGTPPPIVVQAAELYDRIGDMTMTRGTAVFAAALLTAGLVTQADVDRLVHDHPYDFNGAFKKFCGPSRWLPHIGSFKSWFKRTCEVPWKDRWDHARVPKPKEFTPTKPR